MMGYLGVAAAFFALLSVILWWRAQSENRTHEGEFLGRGLRRRNRLGAWATVAMILAALFLVEIVFSPRDSHRHEVGETISLA